MAEETQTPSTEQGSSTQQTQSLDDVYKEFKVEAEAQTFQPQREAKPAAPVQQNPTVPDPVLDPNGYKTWVSQQNELTQKALSNLSGELTQIRAERIRAREEADIKSAVQKFQKIAGDVDEDIAEVALGQKARKDPKFLAVYNNRHKNPQAWDAAVSAYANEYKGKTTYKVDAQIAENQRAAKLSTQGSQAKQKEEPTGLEARFHGKSGREFEAEWRRLVDSSY